MSALTVIAPEKQCRSVLKVLDPPAQGRIEDLVFCIVTAHADKSYGLLVRPLSPIWIATSNTLKEVEFSARGGIDDQARKLIAFPASRTANTALDVMRVLRHNGRHCGSPTQFGPTMNQTALQFHSRPSD